jgi:hypothetical protein
MGHAVLSSLRQDKPSLSAWLMYSKVVRRKVFSLHRCGADRGRIAGQGSRKGRMGSMGSMAEFFVYPVGRCCCAAQEFRAEQQLCPTMKVKIFCPVTCLADYRNSRFAKILR